MEDLFAGIFEQMFTYLLLLPVGFGYLWLRYRNKLRVKETLAKEYENSYANAGSVVLLYSTLLFFRYKNGAARPLGLRHHQKPVLPREATLRR
ncbi:hypothetical protein [Hymenobacter siberiensis]|uniref:hypothetical protein n=1 Tax=Hymenobacter siberiensis TaxID=2848396 RepID=UPI001C1E4825|nr:hypothetical protein [Hymenobacter siberiensis]